MRALIDNPIFGGLVLFLVAVLCFFFGITLGSVATNYLWAVQFDTKVGKSLALLCVLPLLPFLVFRHYFTAPSYENIPPSGKWGASACALLVMLFGGGVVIYLPPLPWSAALAVAVMYIPCCVYAIFNLTAKRAEAAASSEHDRTQQSAIVKSFENTVYFPAYLVCTTAILLGIYWVIAINGLQPIPTDPAVIPEGREFTIYDYYSALYFFIGLVSTEIVIFALFYKRTLPTWAIHVALPILFAGLAFAVYLGTKVAFPKYVIAIYGLTYSLGLAEVVKHIYYLQRLPASTGTEKDIAYYLRGANWASVVFPISSLFVPVVVQEMTALPIVLFVYLAIIGWLFPAPSTKKGFYALVYCFGCAITASVAYMLSVSGYGINSILPENTDPAKFLAQDNGRYWFNATLTLLTLFGASVTLIRFAKDVFGLKLDAFFKSLYNPRLFDYSIGGVMLLLFSVSVYITFCVTIWFLLALGHFPLLTDEAKFEISLRLITSSFAGLMLTVMVLLIILVHPRLMKLYIKEAKELEKIEDDSDKSSGPSIQVPGPGFTSPVAEGAASQSMFTDARNVFISGRPVLSFIAGAASTVLSMASSDVSVVSHLFVFISIFMATMIGFLVNDIYDIPKDQAAGKRKPLATGALSIRTGTFYASGMSVAAIAATAAWLGIDAAVYIALIIVCATIYSPVSAAVPLIKGPYTAVLVLSPFMFASAIGKIGVPAEIYVALFSFVLFREMALDAVDLDGDLRAGFKTVAFFLGRKFAFAFGLLGMLGASAFGAYAFDNSHGQLYMLGGVIVQLAVVIVSFWDERKSLSVSRFVLLAGVLAIGFNA